MEMTRACLEPARAPDTGRTAAASTLDCPFRRILPRYKKKAFSSVFAPTSCSRTLPCWFGPNSPRSASIRSKPRLVRRSAVAPSHPVRGYRAAQQGSERTAHATRVGAGEIGARDQCIGGQRAPLVSPQRLALPLSRFAVRGVQSRARHRDLHPAKAPHEGPRPVAVAVAAGAGALATAARTVQTPAAVTRPRQQNVELAFEHGMEEVANPIAKASFDRVEPVVEKMYRRLGFGLRQARRRAIARHGVISAGVPTPESLVGPSWRLRRLQFPTTPATAPSRHEAPV